MSGEVVNLPPDVPHPLRSPRGIVIDSSVAVKWYVPEEHAAEARRLLAAPLERHVPSLFYIEAASIVWKKARVFHEITEADARAIFARLRMAPLTVHGSESLLDAAFGLALRYKRGVYDSLYLALSVALGMKLVTADKGLYNGVKGGPLDRYIHWVADALDPAGVSLEEPGADR
jgi:predicted nucleic acid-binding protein